MTPTNYRNKTKDELIKEINALRDAVARLDHYKQYENMADEIKAIHDNLMNVGFTDEQAFELVKTMVKNAMPK